MHSFDRIGGVSNLNLRRLSFWSESLVSLKNPFSRNLKEIVERWLVAEGLIHEHIEMESSFHKQLHFENVKSNWAKDSDAVDYDRSL